MEKTSTSQRSPLSPTYWPAEAFSARRVAIYIVAVGIAFLFGLIVAFFAVRLDGHSVLTAGKTMRLTAGLLMAQIVAYIPLLGVALPLLPFAARRTLAELGLHAPHGSDVRAGVIGAVVMYVTAEAAAVAQKYLFHVEGKQQAVQLFGTTHDPSLLAGLVILAVFIAPFVEELIFRGFVFNAFLRYVPVGIAAVLSGALFGAAHGDATAFFPLACGGIVLSLVYYRTGSLVASMFTHGTFNAVNVALVLALGGKA